MADYKLKALGLRYHDDKRIREGQIFFMDEKFVKLDKEGNLISPKNCELISAPSKAVSQKPQPKAVPKKVVEVSEDEVI